MAAGSLTLGGNMSIAVGPLGRNGEATGAINTSGKVAAMYSYSKTRGLFGGLSIEGSVIVERQDANALAYESDVSVKQLLSGGVYPPPEWASPLIKTLESCTGLPGTRKWVDDEHQSVTSPGSDYLFGSGVASPGKEQVPSVKTLKKKSVTSPFPPPSWGRRKDSESYFDSAAAAPEDQTEEDDLYEPSSNTRAPAYNPTPPSTSGKFAPTRFDTHFESDFSLDDPKGRTSSYMGPPAFAKSADTYTPGSPFNSLPPFDTSQLSSANSPHARSMSYSSPFDGSSTNPFAGTNGAGLGHQRSFSLAQPQYLAPKPELSRPLQPHEGVARGIALFDFRAVEVSYSHMSGLSPVVRCLCICDL